MRKHLILAALSLAIATAIFTTETADAESEAGFSLADFQFSQRDSVNLLNREQQGGVAAYDDEKCCKICTTGKACGNSCISRSYQCHQPPGCACDG